MKKIVLVALLAAAGCNKKGADCDAAIAKGMDNFTASIKEHAANPQIVERMTGVVDKLKTTLTQRCKEDAWPSDVVTCFSKVTDRKDMQGCQNKLTPDQSSKLMAEITKVMMGGMAGMPRMPPGVAGHPETLSGGGPGAPATPPAEGSAAAGSPAAGASAAPAPAPSGTPTSAAGGSAAPAAGGW